MNANQGPWLDIARRLRDTRRCPDCGEGLDRSYCPACGLDLSTARAHEVRRLSFDAAEMLERRDQAIAAIRDDTARVIAEANAAMLSAGQPIGPVASHPETSEPASSPVQPSPAPVSRWAPPQEPRRTTASSWRAAERAAAERAAAERAAAEQPVSAPPARERRGGNVSMQPILAGAGALLLAVAAVVFVFFTFGDNLALRAVVTGIVTLTAAGVAALLRRGGLPTTSEAIAALAAVLCWVDVELAMQAGLLGGLPDALARAVVLAVLSPLFILVGHRLRIRTWVSAGFVAALLAPVSAAAGLPASDLTPWWWTATCVTVTVLAWGLARLAPALGKRLDRALRVEQAVLRVVRAAGMPVALAVALTAGDVGSLSAMGATTVLWSAVVLLALAGGLLLRVRAWAATGVLAVPLIPVLAALGMSAWTGAVWRWALAFVLVALIAHAARAALGRIAERLGDQLGRPLTAESGTLRVLRAVGLPLALLAAFVAPTSGPWDVWPTITVLWSAVTVVALVCGWLLRVRSWITTGRVAAPVIALLAVAGRPLGDWFSWWWCLAFVATAGLALLALRGAPAFSRRLGDRLGVPFTAEHVILRIMRGAPLPLALVFALAATDAGVFSADGARVTLWSAITVFAVTSGVWLRVRSWVSTGLVAAPAVPFLLMHAVAWNDWSVALWTLAHVVTALIAWAAYRAVFVLAPRLGKEPAWFLGERFFLRAVRAAGLPVALGHSLILGLLDRDVPLEIPETTPLIFTALLWTVVVLFGAVAGHLLRVRAWVTTAVVVVPLLPMLTLATLDAAYDDGSWLPALALLVSALATLLVRVAAAVSGPRLSSRLRPEQIVLDVMAAGAVGSAVLVSFWVTQPDALPGQGGTAVLLLVTAVVVAVLRRWTHLGRWLVAGGVLVVAAGGVFGFTGQDSAAGWIPVGAVCAWVVLAVLTTPRLLARLRAGSVDGALAPTARDGLLRSGWVTVVVAAAPATILTLGRVLGVWLAGVGAPRADWFAPVGAVVGPVLAPPGSPDTQGGLAGWAIGGSVAFAAATVIAARLVPADAGNRIERWVAPFAVLVAVVGLTLHPGLLAVTSLVVLAVLGAVLVASVADRQAAWPSLRPVVDAVRTAALTAGRAARAARVLGGHELSDGERRAAHHAALLGALVVPVVLAGFSWVSRPTAVVGALVVSGLVLALRGALPRVTHAVLVGLAYVYVLATLGVTLAWLDLSLVAALCIVSAVASLVTIVVTLSARVSAAEWYVVLGVTAAPFLAGVVTVVFERTWWSAGAAAAMLCLELVLLLTTRVGLPALVRGGAAFLLLPTASVMITSTGAMILETSGSPYVLPTAATFVAAVAAGAARVSERIGGRVPDAGPRLAHTIRGMLERSAVLTGVITIWLAYARTAAGPDIAVAVLLILAAGSALVAREPGRRWMWAVSGALALAALWTALGSRGVQLVEAYTFPPAVVAVLLGLFVAWRSARSVSDDGRAVRHAIALAGAGGVLAVVPTFIVYLTRTGPGDWRAYALVGLAFAALAAAALLARTPRGSFRRVRLWLVGMAAFASLAGIIESWRVAPSPGAWPNERGVRDPGRLVSDGTASAVGRIQEAPVGIPFATGPTFVAGLTWAAATVAVLVLCVFVVRPLVRGRHVDLLRSHGFLPALTLGTVAVLAHMEPAWGAVITLFVLEIALLTALVFGVRRMTQGGAMGVAPWVLWICATLIAIAAWAPRELRVETFSAPLGVALVLAGWFGMRHWLRQQGSSSDTVGGGVADGAAGGTDLIERWPVGYAGSWRTMAPGVLALVGPSVLSTATDPLTVRACGVVLVALAAVLAGSRLRLAATFWLGVVTLGVEITVVFAKLGVGVSPLPWILTLVPAALVLLIIATLDERRTAASGGTAAYLRDLR